MFPVVFWMFGFEMTMRMSFDFISSHLLAGLITGAYVFWTVNFFALHAWKPGLLELALRHDARLDWSKEHNWLEKLSGFYYVLAIAIPIVAIAFIVLLSDHDTDERSLSVLSLLGLLGLVSLVWTSRQVRHQLEIQKSFDPEQEEF